VEPDPERLPQEESGYKEPAPAVVEVIEGKRPPRDKPSRERLLSLDAFRGITILLMLLVNNIALDVYTPTQLTHAEWGRGMNLADLVFPWFLFCVGIAVPFSLASMRARELPDWRIDLRIVFRATVIVLLGCLIESSIARRPVFSLGVLQLIGLAYLVGAFLYDLHLIRRLLIAGALLAAYGAALRYMPFPGGPAFEESNNLVRHLNRTYLMPFGLSGLPSVIPTAALVLIGTVIGDLFRHPKLESMRKAAYLALAGAVLVSLGLLANLSVPYSKAIWTPAYILMSAGLGCLTLLGLYLLIDATGWRKWPYALLVFGSNPMVAYVLPILIKLWVLQVWTVAGADGKPVNLQDGFLQWSVEQFGRVPGGWFYTVAYVAFWWLVLWVLYVKRVFVRV
jgi:predicted acyltransferase